MREARRISDLHTVDRAGACMRLSVFGGYSVPWRSPPAPLPRLRKYFSNQWNSLADEFTRSATLIISREKNTARLTSEPGRIFSGNQNIANAWNKEALKR
jgi:hypothetical protein